MRIVYERKILPVEQHTDRCVGRPVVWFRHGRDFGYDNGAQGGVRPRQFRHGVHRGQCLDRHHHRVHPGGSAGGSDWSTSYADRHRCALLCVGGRHGLCMGLVFVPVLSLPGRAGRRWRVGRVSDVHRGDISGGLSRPPGGRHPVQHCPGHSAGVLLQLRGGGAGIWCHGMALDVWCGGLSSRGVHCPVVLHPLQPALAGGAGTCRRGARSVAASGERRARRREGTPEHCGFAGLCPSQHAGAAVLAGLHQARDAGGRDCRLQSVVGHQCVDVLRAAHFLHGGCRQEFGAPAVGRCGWHESGLHDAGVARD